ncbi:MAG: 2-C-methyl-D-erythritol 4-phosphate cytidylyltransferase [Pseudomonadota bacterium]|nr:2-C-methyl-D-erythritol 4-phosphate cytidylyltransferase [Pseudomonadota bacterium]
MSSDPIASLRCFALVPCAGTGSRAGAALAKQYVAIDGMAMVSHTLAALARVRRIVSVLVVVAPGDTAFARHARLPEGKPVDVVACGGASRAESVAAGLDALARRGVQAQDWVLVHDAARCLVRPESIDALIDACLDDPVGGLLAIPVADTLKRAFAGRVDVTLPRAHLWQAQTPQMFRLGLLREALARAGADASDEASAIEAHGLSPRLVPGALENFKITAAGDFALAESILRGRRG